MCTPEMLTSLSICPKKDIIMVAESHRYTAKNIQSCFSVESLPALNRSRKNPVTASIVMISLNAAVIIYSISTVWSVLKQ